MGALDDLLASKQSGNTELSASNSGSALDQLLSNPPKDPFTSTVKSTGAHILNSLAGQPIEDIGQLTGREGLQSFGKGVREYAEGVQKANPSKINSLGDIVDKPGTAIKTALGNLVPQVPLNMAGAYAGGKAGLALPFPANLKPVAGAIGAGVGMFAPSYAQEYTEMRGKQHESGQEDIGKAALAAIPAAGLETAADYIGLGRLVPNGIAGDVLQEGASRLAHVGKQALKGTVAETGTEYLQTGLEQYGGNEDLTTDQAANERNVSAALGGIGGGMMRGGISAFDQRHTNVVPPEQEQAEASKGPLSRAAGHANVAPVENTNSSWISPEFNVNTRQAGLHPWSNPAFNDVRNPTLNPSGQAEQINPTVLQDEQQAEQPIQSAASTDNLNPPRTDDAMVSASGQPVEASRIDSTGNNQETASESAQTELTPELQRAKFRQTELTKAREARGDKRIVNIGGRDYTADSFIAGQITHGGNTFEDAKNNFETLFAQQNKQQETNDNTARPETESTGTDSRDAIPSIDQTGNGLSDSASRDTDTTANFTGFSQQVDTNEKEKAKENIEVNADSVRPAISGDQSVDAQQGNGRRLDGKLGDRSGNGVSGLRGGLSEGERYLSGELYSDTDNAIPDELTQQENKNENATNPYSPESTTETNVNESQPEPRQNIRQSDKQTAKPAHQVNEELAKATESYPQVKALVDGGVSHNDAIIAARDLASGDDGMVKHLAKKHQIQLPEQQVNVKEAQQAKETETTETPAEETGKLNIGDTVTAIDKGGYSGKVTGIREYNGKQYITTEESGKRSFAADKVKLSDVTEPSQETNSGRTHESTTETVEKDGLSPSDNIGSTVPESQDQSRVATRTNSEEGNDRTDGEVSSSNGSGNVNKELDSFAKNYRSYDNDKKEEIKQMMQDMVKTKKENGQPYQNLVDRIAIANQIDSSSDEVDTSAIYAERASGHPENQDHALTQYLVPIKINDTETASKKLDKALDLYSVAAGKLAKAKYDLKQAKNASAKKKAKAEITRLQDKEGIHEDSIAALRDETIPALERLYKEAKKKYGEEKQPTTSTVDDATTPTSREEQGSDTGTQVEVDDAPKPPVATDYASSSEYHAALLEYRKNNRGKSQYATELGSLNKKIANVRKKHTKLLSEKDGARPSAISTNAFRNVDNELNDLINKRDELVASKNNQATQSKQQEPVQAESKPEEATQPVSNIDAAAHEAATSNLNDLKEPTEAQREAGNYKKGHISLHGLNISVENPRGSDRQGIDKNGKQWKRRMAHHYGYIKRSTGADGEHVDVYVGQNPESTKAFVVNQVRQDGSFDEHKVMLGFNTEKEARAGYLKHYPAKWNGLGSIAEMPVSELKSKIDSGELNKPIEQKETKLDNANVETKIDRLSVNLIKEFDGMHPIVKDKNKLAEWINALSDDDYAKLDQYYNKNNKGGFPTSLVGNTSEPLRLLEQMQGIVGRGNKETEPNSSGRKKLKTIFKQLGRNSYKSASAELKSEIDNHPDAELIKQVQKNWSDVLLDVGFENKEDSNKPNSKVFIQC